MSTYPSPRCPDVAGVTGHAHPQPQQFPDENHKIQRLVTLLDQMHLDVVLSGSNIDTASSGPLVPQVQRTLPQVGPVQHLDIVSCWKGLSHQHMLEIDLWEQSFEACLRLLIQQEIQGDLLVHLTNHYGDPLNEPLLVQRIMQELNSKRDTEMVIPMARLAHDMIAHLYTRDPRASNILAWSLSTRDLPSFMYNFICTHDWIFCRSDHSPEPRISFNVSPSYSDGVLTLLVEPQWHLVKTTFPDLPTRLSYGDMYRIKPLFDFTCLGAAELHGFSSYTHDVTYSVPSPTLPLQWDFINEDFHAPLVRSPQLQHDTTVATILCTKIVTRFPHGVRFERMSRYSIKLQVYDTEEVPDHLNSSVHDASWYNVKMAQYLGSSRDFSTETETHHFGSHISGPPLRQYGHGQPHFTQNASSHVYMRENAVSNFVPLDLITSHEQADPLSSHCADKAESQSQSPGKRKARNTYTSTLIRRGPFALDKFEHVDLEVDGKRRKLEPDSYAAEPAIWDLHLTPPVTPDEETATEDLIVYSHLHNVMTGPVGEANASHTATSNTNWFGKLDTTKPGSPPTKHRAAPLSGIKHTKFLWQRPSPPRVDSCASSEAPSSPDKATPSQNEIQRNYKEFEERIKQKEADKAYYEATIPGFDGIVSPTDETDKAFELVFLEASEASDWESDVDWVE